MHILLVYLFNEVFRRTSHGMGKSKVIKKYDEIRTGNSLTEILKRNHWFFIKQNWETIYF